MSKDDKCYKVFNKYWKCYNKYEINMSSLCLYEELLFNICKKNI